MLAPDRLMRSYLDFEKPVAELEAKAEELRALEAGDSAAAIGEEISRLEAKAAQAHALAEDAGRPPSRAAPLSRLCGSADR
jgi:acetyl-CoA carboxylase alpha subunit